MANLKLNMENINDQVVRCCCLCLNHRDIVADHVARASSSAGRHDHSSRLLLRAG